MELWSVDACVKKRIKRKAVEWLGREGKKGEREGKLEVCRGQQA